MRILSISCLLWTILFIHQVKGESKCLRTNRQPDRMCVTKCDPSTGCSAKEKCLCDGDCGYSCVKRDLSCGRPPRVSNARPQYPATNFSSVVTYICNEGHTLSGAAKRTCRANGRWDGVAPNCLKMCSLPTIPFSKYIAKPINYTRKYRTGERITLACKKGFKKKPGGNPVRICISGLWTRFPFQCEGTHGCKRTIRAPRTKCTQKCSPQSGCGSDKYKCLCDGSCGFSCVEIGMSCGNPPSISNGNVVYNDTSFNSTAHYTCNGGYSLNTAPVKRCSAKKRWEGLTPRCLQDCKPPTIPINARISNPSNKYHSGYKVTFKCNEGYNQEGMETQMCFRGSWTVLPFKCTGESKCLRTNLQPDRMCVTKCDPLTGCSAEEKCLCDGDCGYSCVKRDLSCGRPPRVSNAQPQYPATNFSSVVTYVCNEGHTLSGADKRTCRANGRWDGVGPNCLKMCSLPTIPFFTYIAKPVNYTRKYRTGERITLACKKGFKKKPGGNPVRICISGLWTRFPFQCEGIQACKRTIQAPRTKCTQECSPQSGCGSDKYKCLCDGRCGFSCVEIGMSCGNPPSISNGNVVYNNTSYNSTAHYTCNGGYSLNTAPVKRCTAKKRWEGLTPRCLQDCKPPTIPINARISNPSNKYHSGYRVTFKCNEGYNQEGIATQMCFLGSWTVLPFKCTGACNAVLGMHNKKIQDSSITASSQLSLNHVPSLARLDSVQGAWCSAPTDNLTYIEILLSEEKFLTLIKTQGSKKDLRWATKYEIQYQKDGQWIVYRKTDGTRTFDGNVGVTSLNAIALQPRIRTRSVRIYPKFPLSLDGDASLMNVSCLRLELYGCSAPVDGSWGA